MTSPFGWPSHRRCEKSSNNDSRPPRRGRQSEDRTRLPARSPPKELSSRLRKGDPDGKVSQHPSPATRLMEDQSSQAIGGLKSKRYPDSAASCSARCWGSDAAPVYPDHGGEPSYHAWFPPAGGVRLVEFVLPPNSSPNNPGPRPSGQELAAAEKLAPGL